MFEEFIINDDICEDCKVKRCRKCGKVLPSRYWPTPIWTTDGPSFRRYRRGPQWIQEGVTMI